MFSDESSICLFDNYLEGWFRRNTNHEFLVDKHFGKLHIFYAISYVVGKIVSRTFRENCNAELLTEIIRDGLIPQGDHFTLMAGF